MRVAIIGTRRPKKETRYLITRISSVILSLGGGVDTGAADGTDEAAMEGYDQNKSGKLTVYIPWKSYNSNKIPDGASIVVYNKNIHSLWTESVAKLHPKPKALSRGAVALHARNYGIIADPPVNIVIALPKSLSDLGGTGQGMRIAANLGISVYNLLNQEHMDKVIKWIEKIEKLQE